MNNISGATNSSYAATTGGSYKVTVTNTATGCSKTTVTATELTTIREPYATIHPQGPTTFCAGGNVVLKANSATGLTYKWKKNSFFINGATNMNYTATTAGVYKVQVTKSNGCTKVSQGVGVTVPCREDGSVKTEDGEGTFDVKVYPNPSSGDFTFDLENESSENISINVYDMIGKRILSESIHNSSFIISSRSLRCNHNRWKKQKSFTAYKNEIVKNELQQSLTISWILRQSKQTHK